MPNNGSLTVDLSSFNGGETLTVVGKSLNITLKGALAGKTFTIDAPTSNVTDLTTGGTINVKDVDGNSYHYKGSSNIVWSDTNGGRFVNQSAGVANVRVTNGASIKVDGTEGTNSVDLTIDANANVTVSGAVGTINAADTSTVNLQAGTTVESIEGDATIIGNGEIQSVSVATEGALIAALSNNAIKEILIEKDITTKSPIAINRSVTINGNNKRLTVDAGADTWSNTLKSLYFGNGSSGSIVKDIAIVNGVTANDNLIEVENASITLENVTVQGSKRAGMAILLNGKVTLKGVTTLANNTWGGIDVSKVGSHLTLAQGATINYTGALKPNGQTTPIVYIDALNATPTDFVTDNANVLGEPAYVLKTVDSETKVETNVEVSKEEANFVWFGGVLEVK